MFVHVAPPPAPASATIFAIAPSGAEPPPPPAPVGDAPPAPDVTAPSSLVPASGVGSPQPMSRPRSRIVPTHISQPALMLTTSTHAGAEAPTPIRMATGRGSSQSGMFRV